MKTPLLATILFLCLPAWAWPQAASPTLPPRTFPQKEAEPVGHGVVIVIGGIGGMDLLSSTAHLTLPRAGVKHDIREFVWTHGKGKLLPDLRDSLHVHQKAEELADLVRLLKAEDPDRPVYLLGKSGGAGLALKTAELLPARTLERIVLLAAAVSPTYDLRRALMATRQEIVVFYSSHDQLVLNLGTRSFGTIDRVYGPAAGLHGFRVPVEQSPADQELYRRLVQIPWTSRNLLELNNGSHMGTALPGFLSAEVAPWLR